MSICGSSPITTTIRASLKEVERALIISVILVVLVTFAFLRSARAGFVASVAVPVSLIGTFGGMYLLGYSLNNLSLMAMAIAAGFVVDDAIIVLENISRHIEAGMSRIEAALLGAREVGFTVVSMSLSLIAVFIPILLMGHRRPAVPRVRSHAHHRHRDLHGGVAHHHAHDVRLCAAAARARPPGRFFRASERGFAALQSFYDRSLGLVLRHPLVTILIFLATVILNIDLYVTIPKGFSPSKIPAASSPAFAPTRVFRSRRCVGSSGNSCRSFRRIPISPASRASPAAFRPIPASCSPPEAARRPQAVGRPGDRRLRPKLNQVAGANLFMQAVQDIRVGGRQSNSAVPVHPAGQFAVRPLHLGTQAAGSAARRTSRSSPTSIPTSSSAACGSI
jgi:multidrug efflux pump